MKKISKTKIKFNTRTIYTYGDRNRRSISGNETTTPTSTVTSFMAQKH